LWRTLLVILLLIVAAFIFIETPAGQNWLAKKITQKLSRELKTKISFQHISFSLFNKLNLEGFLLEDQHRDTLLSAGNLQVRITDWFFLKDTVELKYVGLENAVANLKRTDSVWNYQFIVDYFTPSSPLSSRPSKKSGITFNLKKLSLKNVVLFQKDEWMGQDMTAAVGDMQMDAKEISVDKKNLEIVSLNLVQPLFSIYNYPAKRNPTQKKDTVQLDPSNAIDSFLKWNPDGWKMNIASLQINNGSFKNGKQGITSEPGYFDPKNIDLTNINGKFQNLRLDKDTFSAKLVLNAKERSGFILKSMKSDVKIDPQGMFFNELDLHTNNSIVRNSFSMTYEDMNDLSDFLHKVKMQADFNDSQISSDDIAYFAPGLRSWKKNISVTGKISGTVSDISGRGLIINAGNNTYLNGDIVLSGLPDINQTFIDFKSNDTRTNYADVVRFVPAAKNVTEPDLASLGNIHFRGSFTGFIHDFVTFGVINTNLGTIKSDLNMKLPQGKEPIYSGNIATSNFQLGKFIHSSDVGLISFSGVVHGHGFSVNALSADVKATIKELEFKGYKYHNIVTNGKLEKQLFNGFFSINDSNLQATLNGLVNINGPQSQFDFVADVEQANLQRLNFTSDKVNFNGKFNLNFTGNNVDNFLGIARITQANLTRNDRRLTFDSLILRSDYVNGIRTLSVNSNEFDGDITGDFHIDDLPNAIQLFLNKYYPSYIKPPSQVISHQNFKFNLVTRQVEDLVQMFDKNLKGFNDSKIEGSLDLAENQLELTAVVPQFRYGNFGFSNTDIHGKGSLSQLSLNGSIQNIAVNDSLSLPNTSFSVVAQNDSSQIKISTASTQAVSKANLNASVITYNDGVKINFDTSSFVLNTKTWTIDKGGELSFRSNTTASGEVVLHESNQQIKLQTVPSDEGNWNDLLIDLANVNIGDISPYFIPKDRLEGLLSGTGKIENPGAKMTATGDFKTEFFRYNGDSIGQLTINKISYDNLKDGNLKFAVTNPDPAHRVNVSANIYLAGDHNDNLIAVETQEYQLNFLESFLGSLFSDMQGYATGKLDIKGNLNALDYVGKAHLHDAGLKLKFTQVFYKIKDTDIELKDHELDLGNIKLLDTLTNGTATLTGTIYHDSWKNMNFDLDVRIDSRPMTLLNTTAADNQSFYGHAVGTGSMILVGPDNDLYMTVDAKSSETDSSHIIIPPTKSRASELAEFLVERTHGHTIRDTLAVASNNKMTFDIGLTADPHTTIEVILDETTGDVVKGRGRGSLNIHSATGEPLTLNGNFDIEDGSYLFTFQSFFKRPFELRKGSDNFIRWNGDPNDAIIHFDAQYTAENVSFAPLASSISGVEGRAQTTRENVNVIVTMSGKLLQPKFDFKLDFPSSSITISDPVLAQNLTQIENNPIELNKQVTYLIVFNSFSPVGTPGNTSSATAATASGGIPSAINELAYNTISSLLFNELNKQFSNILAQIFKDDKLKVSLSGSVYNRNLVTSTGSNDFQINTGNVNLTVSRAVFNNRLVITAGSTLDIPFTNQSTVEQTFRFLPDVTAEWLINDKGTIRATFFYRQNLDFITGNASTSTSTITKRIGGGLGYRKEVDHIGDLFRGKKKQKKQNQTPAPAVQSTPAPQSQNSKGSN
jgi:translocation-and-assembly-module (TAM) inner membrane subunit TamB-like protein